VCHWYYRESGWKRVRSIGWHALKHHDHDQGTKFCVDSQMQKSLQSLNHTHLQVFNLIIQFRICQIPRVVEPCFSAIGFKDS
jgi:hypothetical protein